MTATAALEAAFPDAAQEDSAAAAAAGARAGAASAQRPRPAAAAAVKPQDITADILCVADVGTFMGHRMFKTPFACWASWLKEAGAPALLQQCCPADASGQRSMLLTRARVEN
jgi:hypothetical protein